jgi:hypothetical protein
MRKAEQMNEKSVRIFQPIFEPGYFPSSKQATNHLIVTFYGTTTGYMQFVVYCGNPTKQ